MKLLTLLSDPEYSLPLVNNSGLTFVEFLENKFQKYIYELKNSVDLLDGLNNILQSHSELIRLTEVLAVEVIEIIKLKKQGYNSESYQRFNSLMSSFNTFFRTIDSITYLDATFYRAVNTEGKNPGDLLNQARLFHAPFEYSTKVGCGRFSYQGVPFLYLSTNIITSYLETQTNSLNFFQAAKFNNKIPLTVLDFEYRIPTLVGSTVQYEQNLQRLALLLPLLISCFATVNEKDIAPDEYIIPQTLCEWMRNTNIFDGIQYPSTKINGNFKKDFYCIVIPPQTFPKDGKGYCTYLRDNLFHMSQVCSWEHHQVEINTHFTSTFTAGIQINSQVETLEWNSKVLEYEMTEIGQMEYYLFSLPSDKITFT